MIDEMPVSGDFSKVQRLNVNLAVALQPYEPLQDHSRQPVVDPPSDMNSIQLKRVFRYTHRNMVFLSRVLRHWRQNQENLERHPANSLSIYLSIISACPTAIKQLELVGVLDWF